MILNGRLPWNAIMEWPPWQHGWVGMAQQRRRCAYGVRGAPRLDVRSQPPPPSNSKYVNPPRTMHLQRERTHSSAQNPTPGPLQWQSFGLCGSTQQSTFVRKRLFYTTYHPSFAFLLTMCLFYFNKIGSYYNQPQPSPGQRICMFRIFMQKYKIDQDRAGIAYFF